MAKKPYSGPWRKIRLQVLERDNYECQIRGPKCTGRATAVDHIVALQHGGSWWDTANLRGTCVHCNNGRIDQSRREAWRTARTRIALVVGPPGAGKTSWVHANKGPNDLVIDYDAIAVALGSDTTHGHDPHLHAATMAARNAILTKLRKGQIDVGRCWLISANPRAEQFLPFHTVVTVDPGKDEVLRRVRESDRPATNIDLVEAWYLERSGAVGAASGPASRDW